MNVRPWCWCWGRWQWLTGLSIVFFLLGVVVEYPLLISSHNPMQKTFSLFESAIRKWKIAFQRLSVSVQGTQFPCFWIIPMTLNRTETVCWITPNDSANSSCVWLWSSSSNAFNSSNFFGCPERGLSSTLKSPSLKRQNHSLHDLSVEVIINFDKHSMGFSCTFLSIKAKNQNLPQMLLG